MVPFWGDHVLEKAMNSKGFGAFWPSRGVQFWGHFWIPGLWEFSRKLRGIEQPNRENDKLEELKSQNPGNN